MAPGNGLHLSKGFLWTMIGLVWIATGCSTPGVRLKGTDRMYPPDTVVTSPSGDVIAFDTLVEALSRASIVYIGEEHTNANHHAVQLRIIEALYDRNPRITVGMEMFDYRYDEVLEGWSSGQLDRQAFLEKTHWYANWRMDYELYAGILDYIQAHRIRLVGLNLPFHVPPLIRTGGLDSLLEDESRHLPERVDLEVDAHREMVEAIFRRHQHFLKGSPSFEHFYEAQCAWEDKMAESIAAKSGEGPMVVLVGNGHIIRKYGIPDRAFARTGKAFRTVYLASSGQEVEVDYGDYIWVTP